MLGVIKATAMYVAMMVNQTGVSLKSKCHTAYSSSMVGEDLMGWCYLVAHPPGPFAKQDERNNIIPSPSPAFTRIYSCRPRTPLSQLLLLALAHTSHVCPLHRYLIMSGTYNYGHIKQLDV